MNRLPDYLEAPAAEYRIEQARRKHDRPSLWQPFAGKPQEAAYHSTADILLYGGAAGGGKSDLLLGLGFTQHIHSIIFRREYTQLKAVIRRGNQILKPLGIRYVGGDARVWRDIPDGNTERTVELGAVRLEEDTEKFQGNPHDLIGFDELTHFAQSQFRFLIGWNRTDVQGQRTRVVAASNPPLDIEQEWVIDYWSPWLDDDYKGVKALPGEPRWFITRDNEDLEVEDGNPVLIGGEYIQPLSRTFIPAFVEDNPVYMATGYKAVLQAMQTELQDPLLRGIFRRFKGSHPYQVIPTQWVLDAQERFKQRHKPELRIRAMGIDVARGGADETVFARLYGNWFDKLITFPGKETPDGDEVARKVLEYYEGCEQVGIDVIGVGGSPYDILKKTISITPINASEGSSSVDSSGVYGFANTRSQMWWQFREALDPQNGHEICLPPDPELKADLCAPRYKIAGANYKVESKDDIKERLKRSPDKGDAVVMAWYMATNPQVQIFL